MGGLVEGGTGVEVEVLKTQEGLDGYKKISFICILQVLRRRKAAN